MPEPTEPSQGTTKAEVRPAGADRSAAVQRGETVRENGGQRRSMHAGSPETSTRLRRTLDYLRAAHGWVSTAELAAFTGSMAVHSDTAALRVWLRKRGADLECRYGWTTPEGRRVYLWRVGEE